MTTSHRVEDHRGAASAAWKLRHSLWLLPSILGLGMISWTGLGYVAGRTRNRTATALAVLFFVAAVIGMIWVGNEAPGQNVSGGYPVLLWAAGILASALLNPMYLRWAWANAGHGAAPLSHGASTSPHPGRPRATQPDHGQAARPGDGMMVIQDVLPGAAPHGAPTSYGPGGASDQWPSASAHDMQTGAPASLGTAVVGSRAYDRHRTTVRADLDDATLARAIDALAAAPGGCLDERELAMVLAVPTHGVHEGISALARQLNVDGYGVIRREGRLTVLDVSLLRQQFQI